MYFSKVNGTIYINYKNEFGKMTRTSTKTKNKNDAMVFLTDFKEKLKEKKESLTKMNQVTLEEFSKTYLEYVKNHFSSGTYCNKEYSLRKFQEVCGNKYLIQYTVLDAEKYKSYRLKETGTGKTTINGCLIKLKAAFNVAMKWNLLKDNIFENVEYFQEIENERLSLSTSDIAKLFPAIKDKDFYKLCLFALMTGCRRNELLNILYQDIDFENKTLKIVNKENFQTKTGRIRYIPIANVLFKYLDRNEAPETYVFKKFAEDYISHKFKKYVRDLGLNENICFHSLRHSFATHYLKNSGNIFYLKSFLGHSSLGTTQKYLTVLNEDMRKSIDGMKFRIGVAS